MCEFPSAPCMHLRVCMHGCNLRRTALVPDQGCMTPPPSRPHQAPQARPRCPASTRTRTAAWRVLAPPSSLRPSRDLEGPRATSRRAWATTARRRSRASHRHGTTGAHAHHSGCSLNVHITQAVQGCACTALGVHSGVLAHHFLAAQGRTPTLLRLHA